MDPASAAITFVGFAASLATLVAVVVDSAKTLNNLQQQLRAAPENVRRLVKRFGILQNLLQVVQALSQAHGETEVPEGLCQIWEGAAAQLKDDMDAFGTLVARLEQALNSSKGSAMKFRLRSRDFFSEPKVTEFEQKFRAHLDTLQLIKACITDLKLDTFKSQNRKLESIALNGFQAVYSGLLTLESREQQRTQLHERTNAGIEDCVHLLRSNLELGPLQSTARSRLRGKKSKPSVAATVYLEVRGYRLPFGRLEVRISRKSLSSHSGDTDDRTSSISQIGFGFVPPHWLSNLTVQSKFDLFYNVNSDLPGLGFKLSTVSINRNPLLIEAIETGDVAALQQLFTAGLARPSDRISVISFHSESLLGYYCSWCHFNSPIVEQKSLELFRFLAQTSGSDLQNEFGMLLLGTNRSDSRLIKSYLEVFLVNGGSVISDIDTPAYGPPLLSLVGSEIGFFSDDLSHSIFGQGESWTAEDLGPMDAWIIGVSAHADRRFRARLESYLHNSFQSAFTPRRNIPSEQSVGNAFNINVIVAQVMSAAADDRVSFIHAICTSGTHLMLKPFLDAGIDVNEDTSADGSYLGSAASVRNSDIFHMLLNSDAAVGPALRYVSSNFTWSADDLRCYLQPMVDQVTLLDFTDHRHDPIHKLMHSTLDSDVITQTLEHLLGAGLFDNDRLFGGECTVLYESYIFNAIYKSHGRALDLFLSYGINPDRQISDQFKCGSKYSEYRSYTWLTLAVHTGKASCVKVLLKYADMHVRDGSGCNALELARNFAAGGHPRWTEYRQHVGKEDDDEVLAVLEKALASQPISNSGDLTITHDVIQKPDAEPGLFAYGKWKGKSIPPYSWYDII
ncbi:hypothetical protein MMC11_001004 [Xylographa trunciseda]|nr:hypothetical protein [Xylographa trunciseda]